MAIQHYVKMSTRDEKEFCIDWTVRLPTGVTVTDITNTHTRQDGGTPVTPTKDVSAAPITYSYMPAGLSVGTHYLDVVATTSNSSISPHVRFVITVEY